MPSGIECHERAGSVERRHYRASLPIGIRERLFFLHHNGVAVFVIHSFERCARSLTVESCREDRQGCNSDMFSRRERGPQDNCQQPDRPKHSNSDTVFNGPGK